MSVTVSTDVDFSSGIEPDRKEPGIRKKRLPPNHLNAKKKKKKNCFSCGGLILLGRNSCLREGEKPLKRNVIEYS